MVLTLFSFFFWGGGVQLPIFNQAQCDAKATVVFGEPGFITDDMICAGGELGRDTCFGDGGSLLMCNGKIVGVALGGFCGHIRTVPSVC